MTENIGKTCLMFFFVFRHFTFQNPTLLSKHSKKIHQEGKQNITLASRDMKTLWRNFIETPNSTGSIEEKFVAQKRFRHAFDVSLS